ncbi:hypothetical protein GALL_395070 [mine drainage metagenome]|uniref:Uncharacterized protein n=1 Tax=mine drainage metagenome TaxID=410659 RepID=A0A1J5Q511_9ZZZZ
MKQKIIIQPHQVLHARIFMAVFCAPGLLFIWSACLGWIDLKDKLFWQFSLFFLLPQLLIYLLGKQYIKTHFGVGK